MLKDLKDQSLGPEICLECLILVVEKVVFFSIMMMLMTCLTLVMVSFLVKNLQKLLTLMKTTKVIYH